MAQNSKTTETEPTAKPSSAVESLTFEDAMTELEAIVAALEKGDVALEESITLFERGEVLKRHGDSLLKSAESRIERIRLSAEGTYDGTEPLGSS